MTTLFTIGYEQKQPENFISVLKKHGVTLVIDVREKPLSRKKGFSKNSLSKILNDNQIRYLHLKELGSPSDIRSELYKTKNYPLFFKKYLSYLNKQTETLNKVVKEANKENGACIMCFEKDPLKCHRCVITDYLLAKYSNEVKVEHL